MTRESHKKGKKKHFYPRGETDSGCRRLRGCSFFGRIIFFFSLFETGSLLSKKCGLA